MASIVTPKASILQTVSDNLLKTCLNNDWGDERTVHTPSREKEALLQVLWGQTSRLADRLYLEQRLVL